MSHYERPDDNNDLFLLGEQLRELREAQGMSYDDVAKSTHVRPHILKAIEEGRLEGIAAPVYVRGFVKTYCEFLMAHDLWKKYSARLSSLEPPRSSTGGILAPVDISHPRPVFRRTSIIWVYIILVIAVLGATFLLWNQHKNPEKAGNGFFLRFSSPQAEQPMSPQADFPESTQPEPETATMFAAISDEMRDESVSAISPISDEQNFATHATASMDLQQQNLSVDLSWLDGNAPADIGLNIPVAQSQIPDQRLLIETTGPVRLIVQQDGSVVTRRSLVAGGVRSYDVTGSTPVSLSAGNAADVTWYGKKYTPIGSDNKPLGLVFYPDGRVSITEGKSHHFGNSSNTTGN